MVWKGFFPLVQPAILSECTSLILSQAGIELLLSPCRTTHLVGMHFCNSRPGWNRSTSVYYQLPLLYYITSNIIRVIKSTFKIHYTCVTLTKFLLFDLATLKINYNSPKRYHHLHCHHRSVEPVSYHVIHVVWSHQLSWLIKCHMYWRRCYSFSSSTIFLWSFTTYLFCCKTYPFLLTDARSNHICQYYSFTLKLEYGCFFDFSLLLSIFSSILSNTAWILYTAGSCTTSAFLKSSCLRFHPPALLPISLALLKPIRQ